MSWVARISVALVGILHVGFALLETVFWNTEIGRAIFDTTPEEAALMAPLAANQGLYNGFLAAGLFWAAAAARRDLSVFFLVCVSVAGVVGALTAKPTVLLVQTIPALIALASLWTTKRA